VKRVVLDQRDLMSAKLGKELGYDLGFAGSYAMGLTQGSEIIGVVAFNHFYHPTICMHVWGKPGALWCTREFRFHAFYYPFEYLRCARITGLVPEGNQAARRFNEHLGFRLEGKMERALPNAENLLIYRMFREECKWTNPDYSKRSLAVA
jgi:RimJ/RimL family protein N-acetyltransferase